MPGHWIRASKALGRRVPVDGPYPHICRATVAAEDTVSALPLQVARWEAKRYCTACAQEHYQRDHPSTPDIRRPDTMPAAGSRREVAPAAATRGWHVFPLRPDDKRPAFPDPPAEA